MASLIPTKASKHDWYSQSVELRQDIMKTDILCEVLYQGEDDERVSQILNEAIEKMREFEGKYSRFRKENDLWELNHTSPLAVSEEMFQLLSCAQFFFQKTGGVFDPTILDSLESEGYVSGVYQGGGATKTVYVG